MGPKALHALALLALVVVAGFLAFGRESSDNRVLVASALGTTALVLTAPYLLAVMTSGQKRRLASGARGALIQQRHRGLSVHEIRTLLSGELAALPSLGDAASASAHPLLAREIAGVRRATARLLEAEPRPAAGHSAAAAWDSRAHDLLAAIADLRKRERRARWAYRLNLPLSREAAANFAAVRTAERIERLTDAMSSYVVPSSRGGAHG
ncbi:hypothetical protein AB0F81_38870 [Actinoplanes sp. NPDC024001]|uniref:hypothetical protein n=1 Tax=Actinoplanes sp. NPDC024001 TaxID=3154598 RepID=UPI0034092169